MQKKSIFNRSVGLVEIFCEKYPAKITFSKLASVPVKQISGKMEEKRELVLKKTKLRNMRFFGVLIASFEEAQRRSKQTFIAS